MGQVLKLLNMEANTKQTEPPAVFLGRRPKWTRAPPTVVNRSPQ